MQIPAKVGQSTVQINIMSITWRTAALPNALFINSGIIEANLVNLNQEFNLSYITDLIAQKTSGEEKSLLENTDLIFHKQECDRLIEKLETASKNSHLPDTTSAKPALNDLLIRLRLTVISNM